MKIATRATTPITHGAMRRQVMLGRESSIVGGMSCWRLSASDTKHAARSGGRQSIASFRPMPSGPLGEHPLAGEVRLQPLGQVAADAPGMAATSSIDASRILRTDPNRFSSAFFRPGPMPATSSSSLAAPACRGRRGDR